MPAISVRMSGGASGGRSGPGRSPKIGKIDSPVLPVLEEGDMAFLKDFLRLEGERAPCHKAGATYPTMVSQLFQQSLVVSTRPAWKRIRGLLLL